MAEHKSPPEKHRINYSKTGGPYNSILEKEGRRNKFSLKIYQYSATITKISIYRHQFLPRTASSTAWMESSGRGSSQGSPAKVSR